MMYVDNVMVAFVDSAEIHKVHMQEQNCNMDTKKLGVVEYLDKYEVVCCDEYVVACFDEGVLA